MQFHRTNYRLTTACAFQGIAVLISAGVNPLTCLRFAGLRINRGNYGCFFYNERRTTEIACTVGLAPSIFVMFKLKQVHDVFGIGSENVRVIIPVQLAGGTLRLDVRVCKCSLWPPSNALCRKQRRQAEPTVDVGQCISTMTSCHPDVHAVLDLNFHSTVARNALRIGSSGKGPSLPHTFQEKVGPLCFVRLMKNIGMSKIDRLTDNR